VEKTMRQALKSDRARTVVGRISEFGLMELVRQRMGSSALAVTTEPCPCCGGTGVRRNMEWQSLQIIKDIYRQLRKPGHPSPMQVRVKEEAALYMLNHKREKLLEMERRFDTRVDLLIDREHCD
jgi:ribonuclease E